MVAPTSGFFDTLKTGLAAGLLLSSNSPGHHKGGDAGGDGIRAGDGVLGVGCGGDGDLAGDRGEQARDGVVVVLGARRPGGAFEGDGEGREPGIEGVGDGGVVRGHHGLVAGVLDDEGVGHPVVIHHLGGGDGLGDGQQRSGLGRDGLVGGDRGAEAVAGDGDGVEDGALSGGVCVGIGPGLVDDDNIAPGGDADAGDHQGRPGGYGRGGLGCAVGEHGHGPGLIGQGIHRAAAEGVAAQIVRHRQVSQGGRAGVPQGHHIGHEPPGGVVALHRGLRRRQNVQNLAVGNVGVGGVSVVSQGRLIGKDRHNLPPNIKFRGEPPVRHSMQEGRGVIRIIQT